MKITMFILLGFALGACASQKNETLNFELPSEADFKKQWYQRGAEISRYTLLQSRYGEIHKGDAVLLFVTEPFNPNTQVKADNPTIESVPMLKLNEYRRFYTGIYPYTAITSSFSPIEVETKPVPLKFTTTVQEWCGHVFQQMNLRKEGYEVQSFSYFESEGDKKFKLPALLSEDGLFNLIRINPNKLPIGSLKILPSSFYSRLVHKPMDPRDAKGNLSLARLKKEGPELALYTLEMPSDNRTLKIYFQKEFPFRIEKWEDSYPGIMGGKTLTTSATRTNTIMSAYWGKNKNKDRMLLEKLGLKPF